MSVGIVTRVIKKVSQLLDVDVSSAATGSSLIYNGSGWVTLKHNFAGTTAPGVGDDSADGYAVGSLWFDLTSSPKEIYRCMDATEGAAVWLNTSLELGDLTAALDAKVSHSLSTASNDFLIGSGSNSWIKKTLAEVLAILGKDAASGLASLDASSKVVQDPANATATATASKIPIADASGNLDTWIKRVFRTISVKTDSYVIQASDLWTTIVMNSSSDKILTMCSMGESNDGDRIRIQSRGTGRLTLQNVDTDKIADSSATGTCYTDTDTIANIELEYRHADTTWIIISGCGTWVTT